MTDPYRKSAKTEQDGPFPLEKILTVSARDYCESVGKKLSAYEMQGVHVINVREPFKRENSLNKFREAIPANAEAVVDYKLLFVEDGNKDNLYGTALIPRPKEPSSIEGLHTGVS